MYPLFLHQDESVWSIRTWTLEPNLPEDLHRNISGVNIRMTRAPRSHRCVPVNGGRSVSCLCRRRIEPAGSGSSGSSRSDGGDASTWPPSPSPGRPPPADRTPACCRSPCLHVRRDVRWADGPVPSNTSAVCSHTPDHPGSSVLWWNWKLLTGSHETCREGTFESQSEDSRPLRPTWRVEFLKARSLVHFHFRTVKSYQQLKRMSRTQQTL